MIAMGIKTYVGRGVGAHFINELLESRSFIYVASRWISPEYAEKLIAKAREGVEVRIITSNDREKNHQRALKIILDSLKPPLLKRGWTPPNLEVGVVREKYLHVKLYIGDHIAAMGSANFTYLGLWENIEHVAVFSDRDTIDMLRKDFQTLWKLYIEDKKTVEKVITLRDIAKAIGKTIKWLLKE